MPYEDLDDCSLFVGCSQCGQPISKSVLEKRVSRGSDEDRCKDCCAKPVEYLSYREFTCKPWQGEFDWELMVPVDEGQPFMPGYRLCGHADCVLKGHIIGILEMTAQAREEGISMTALVRRLDAQRMSGAATKMIADKRKEKK
jgi:hypothetical protein